MKLSTSFRHLNSRTSNAIKLLQLVDVRLMEDSQQKTIIVYRAGTEVGPSFDSDSDEGDFYLSIHHSYTILSSMYQIS